MSVSPHLTPRGTPLSGPPRLPRTWRSLLTLSLASIGFHLPSPFSDRQRPPLPGQHSLLAQPPTPLPDEGIRGRAFGYTEPGMVAARPGVGAGKNPGLHMDYPARPSPLIPDPAHTESRHVTGALDAGTHAVRGLYRWPAPARYINPQHYPGVEPHGPTPGNKPGMGPCGFGKRVGVVTTVVCCSFLRRWLLRLGLSMARRRRPPSRTCFLCGVVRRR